MLSAPVALTGAIGSWRPTGDEAPRAGDAALVEALQRVHRPVYVTDLQGSLGVAQDGVVTLGTRESGEGIPLRAFAGALRPEQLGDPAFRAAHGLRYAYVAGAMANGIASEELVEAMGKAGMLGFFGAAGLEPKRVEAAISRIQAALGDAPYGFNLIHSPAEPQVEAEISRLYVARGVHRVCASAFLALTVPLLRYRYHGIRANGDGGITLPNHVFAKVSRVEVARQFFSPPPEEMLRQLIADGTLTEAQAELARRVPVAEDLTAEADSGGHTDNRPAITLLPTMLALRDALQARFNYPRPLRVGLAGGIATPASAAAAFAMGAAYVMTGSINQACVEAGTSPAVRDMLAAAEQADVMMAPAADMFEMGVKVQVLKRGTMFAMKARKLYDIYRAHTSLDDIPPPVRAQLEKDYFRNSLESAWESTKSFFTHRDPRQIERAEKDPHHKMALVFRSYLGQSSKWANTGLADRRMDYQVWCGPAMGAFNEWTHGTFLAQAANRDAVTVALNILVGASALTRAAQLRQQGLALPAAAGQFVPRPRAELAALLAE
jgi:PfaD family protein